ncbi:TPA: HIT domain-containing protein [Candidatus Woesearchaeota archaeon]|nr:HIT domain-containing protein [Candidatus Woesearchaeota archaeon]
MSDNDESSEETSNLSPSEIEELQRKNCVFCHIASGKVPARKVYEDDVCLAILDINPAGPGHVLLMPKQHYTVMFNVPEDVLGHVFIIAKALSQAGLKALQAKGSTIFAANGVAAGQRAPHFMLHVIPRTPSDGVGLYIPSRALPEKQAEQIAAALATALGGRKGEAPVDATPAKQDSGQKGETAPEVKQDDPKQGKTSGKKSDAIDLDAIASLLAKEGK